MIGQTISHYRIIDKLGEGGMGVVYKAEDTKLERMVALKFLPPHLLRNEGVRERFRREAKAAAAIDHPNVCTVYEVDEHEGRTFIAMAFLDGRTLSGRIEQGPLSPREALSIAVQIAEGLEAAHAKGVVHRDIKPENVMLVEGSRGLVKIMDFGLAQLGGASELTQEGTTLGTVYYMSPEQCEGAKVDHRSDLWALGVVLYEMLTGDRPFRGEFGQAVMYSIFNEAPAEADLPPRLAAVIEKCLAKKAEDRYPDATALLSDLAEAQPDSAAAPVAVEAAPPPPRRLWPAAAAVAVLAAGGWWGYQLYQDHRIETETLPRIAELTDQQRFDDAFALLGEAQERLGDDERLIPLFERAGVPLSIVTDPPDADVYVKAYDDLDGEWEFLGQSPIDRYYVPRGHIHRWRASRWRIEKQGFRPVESIDPENAMDENTFVFPLVAEAAGDAGDCLIPAARDGSLGDFSIGCFEVTNAEFKRFVDAGGYSKPEYWEHVFVRAGDEISFKQAMDAFHDTTGRPGPATWRLGSYAEGEDSHPVTGVSWYEAAAFAKFAGKSLPTEQQWWRAASGFAEAITPQSNFSGKKLSPVGAYPAVHRWGVHDMAGNAKEWVWNAVGEDRRLLGGGFDEPTYRFVQSDTQSPIDRSPANGFRLAVYDPDPKLLAPIELAPFRDYSRLQPADDRTFAIYKSLLDYPSGDLDAETLETDDSSPYWRKLKVEYNAAYGNERIPAYLLLPKNAIAPYQTVLYFPGLGAFQSSSSQYLTDWGMLPPIVRSGRAVLYPVYKGSYERRTQNNQSSRRDQVVMNIRDVRRSLDYLESRDDVDRDRLGYAGYSWGAMMAAQSLASDDRFKVVVLFNGGLPGRAFLGEELDPLHYWPRVTLPALLVNGTLDNTFPTEESQKPLFRLLGTPEADKRQVFSERGHARSTLSDEEIAETLAFLDKYLGPVRIQ